MIIDGNCFIAPLECVEKRVLWYSSQGSIITHPHFSHWTQAIVMGWWIVESWMLWPRLSNTWSTYKIHTRYRTPEYTLWWPDGSWRVSLWILWPRCDTEQHTSHCPGIKTNGGHQGHLQQQIWGCDPVLMCGWWLVVWIMNGNISPGSALHPLP